MIMPQAQSTNNPRFLFYVLIMRLVDIKDLPHSLHGGLRMMIGLHFFIQVQLAIHMSRPSDGSIHLIHLEYGQLIPLLCKKGHLYYGR